LVKICADLDRKNKLKSAPLVTNELEESKPACVTANESSGITKDRELIVDRRSLDEEKSTLEYWEHMRAADFNATWPNRVTKFFQATNIIVLLNHIR
jgi:hypothetical protein